MKATQFWNYQSAPPPQSVVAHALTGAGSPNLGSILAFLTYVFGGQNLGYGPNPRAIRGGTAPSTHSYGAALDWRYMPSDSRNPGDTRWVIDSYRAAQEMMQFLVDHSAELGIQAIHDYWGDRIWRAYRSGDDNGGWRKQNGAGGGMGERWASYIHIEVHPNAYFDGRAVTERVDFGTPAEPPPPPPPPPPAPAPVPTKEITVEFTSVTMRKGDKGSHVKWLQKRINEIAGQGLVEDGDFGAQTETGVKNFQAFFGLGADGIVGAKTQRAVVEIGLATGN